METDASGAGLGAVLAQHQSDGTQLHMPVSPRLLQQHEHNYGITELEALGVVWAVKHFQPYLPCTVYTDHEALKLLLNTLQPTRWGTRLSSTLVYIRICVTEL